ILMTAYPLRLRDQPEMADHFTRIMTKPLNLQELRQAVDAALDEKAAPLSEPSAPREPPRHLVRPNQIERSGQEYSGIAESRQPDRASPIPTRRKLALALAGAAFLILLAGGAAVVAGKINLPGMAPAKTELINQPQPLPRVELIKGMEKTLDV